MMVQVSSRTLFVGQLVDSVNNNPQVLNTRALLSRFSDPRLRWLAPNYHAPDQAVASSPHVRLVRLWRSRLWQIHKMALYQSQVDAIFYPNAYWFDDWGMRLRKLCGRQVPVIATMEGFGGDEARERQLSEWAGHPVYCQRVLPKLLTRIDRVLNDATHIIAISPFIASLGRRLYGDKFSVLPLGIDGTVFHPHNRRQRERFTVVGAGRMYANKRPDLFLTLAKRFPEVDFIWYGDGEMRQDLIREAQERTCRNLSFPGPVPNHELAERFREAHLFVLPSWAEGVPKVTQEAAACGLPVVIFGFYEAPSVVDGVNGYVVWDDNELFARIGALIKHQDTAASLGARGTEMAREWGWDTIAPLWEERLLHVVEG
jgi:hypothetical protein